MRLQLSLDRELIRVLDLLFYARTGRIGPGRRGTIAAVDVGEPRAEPTGKVVAEEESSDRRALPGSVAAVPVYEDSWAGPFASSVRRSGGQLVASGRIPTQALLAAVEADAQTVEQGT